MKPIISIAVAMALVAAADLSAQQAGSAPARTAAAAPAPAEAQPAQTGSHIIQRVLVKVNGEIFTQTDLEHLQIDAVRQKRPDISSSADLQSNQVLMPLLQQVTPDILVDQVDQLLLVQFGKAAGYHMTDDQFQKFVENFKKDKKINDAELKSALADEGMTMDSWRTIAEQQYIVQQVQRNEIVSRANVTDEELRQYYQAHPDEFKTASTVKLREILVAVPTTMVGGRPSFNAAADESAKTKIDGIRERLVKGEDFAKLAAEVSDSDTKTTGGLMTEFNLADLSPEFRKILDPMKPGDVTTPIRTARGWQLLKLESISQPVLKPFDQVHDDLRMKVLETRMDAETAKFLVKIRTQALIEWKDPNLKQIYDKRLAERMAQGK